MKLSLFGCIVALTCTQSLVFAQFNVRRDASGNLLDNLVVQAGKTFVVSRSNLSGGTALTLGTHYFDSLSAARTLTFTGTPVEGVQTSLKLTVTGVRTLTIPSCKRAGEANNALTAVTLYPGVHTLSWTYVGAEYVLTDSVGILSNDIATVDPTATDDSTSGYSKHSKWINTSAGRLFECIDATATAAVWKQTASITTSAHTILGNNTGSTATASGLTAQQVNAELVATLNAQVGTTYTLVLTDANNVVSMANASANTLTVPPNSSVAFPVGTAIQVKQGGAGTTTIAAGGGVTVNNTGSLVIGTQNAYVELYKTATDTWDLVSSVAGSGSGTVTTVSVASANGFAGTVATATSTPAITLTTSVTGLLKGNGTAISAAVSGTDYAPATSGSAILKGNGAGGTATAVSGTDYAPATSGSAVLKGNGAGGTATATAGTDYENALTFAGGLTRSTNTITDIPAVNAQVGTTYTLVLADQSKVVSMSNASANTLTIPLNSSVAYSVGTLIPVLQGGAGVTSIAATGGVTLNAPGGSKIGVQNAFGYLIKTATDTWTFSTTVLHGSVTNDAAIAGDPGEVVESKVATGSAVTITTATGANVTSISLTAGDWWVSGNVNFVTTTATVTVWSGGITATTATLPVDGTEAYSAVGVTTASTNETVTVAPQRISLASTTTIFLVAKSTFSAGTNKAFGHIIALRTR